MFINVCMIYVWKKCKFRYCFNSTFISICFRICISMNSKWRAIQIHVQHVLDISYSNDKSFYAQIVITTVITRFLPLFVLQSKWNWMSYWTLYEFMFNNWYWALLYFTLRMLLFSYDLLITSLIDNSKNFEYQI